MELVKGTESPGGVERPESPLRQVWVAERAKGQFRDSLVAIFHFNLHDQRHRYELILRV
jgi:hypothetical protein